MYEYVIFDADHTLIDFYEDERRAFRRMFDRYGVSYDNEIVEKCRMLSDQTWAEAGLNDVHLPEVQLSFHSTYFAHMPFLMTRVSDLVGLPVSSDEAAKYFASQFYVPSVALPNALQTFAACAQKYKVCVATNGITDMQQARLAQFLPYAHQLFVSQELGIIKPNPLFFQRMVERLKTSKGKCLFVGDSLASDVRGCNDYGMDCVWLNRQKKPLPEWANVVGEIDDITEILPLIGVENP